MGYRVLFSLFKCCLQWLSYTNKLEVVDKGFQVGLIRLILGLTQAGIMAVLALTNTLGPIKRVVVLMFPCQLFPRDWNNLLMSGSRNPVHMKWDLCNKSFPRKKLIEIWWKEILLGL